MAEGLGVDVDWSGLCAPGDVPAYLASIDVLVVPRSRTLEHVVEQFGRVVVEAMWAGTPVVVSDSGALPEVVGRFGVIVHEEATSRRWRPS